MTRHGTRSRGCIQVALTNAPASASTASPSVHLSESIKGAVSTAFKNSGPAKERLELTSLSKSLDVNHS